MALTHFEEIRSRAEARKGADAVARRMAHYVGRSDGPPPSDDRVLAAMARHIFQSGISWKVVDAKWPGIEEAFHGFDPGFLNIQPDDFWHDLTNDRRVIRHGAKIMAVRNNAAFVSALSKEHGSAAKFLIDWPHEDQIGLLAFLEKRGDRLGGSTGQYVLRAIGRPSFVMSRDVVACVKAVGAPVTGDGSTKSDRRAIQEAFNQWAEESGLTMAEISVVCALSIDAA